MKKYYKVTIDFDGRQDSCSAYGGKANVRYQINSWSEAPAWLSEKGYGLFVFDSLKKAQKFSKYLSLTGLKIWECEIEGKFPSLPVPLSRSYLECGYLLPVAGSKFPKGTVMVKKIKLLKLIKG
jgi:hypothetical protein